MIKLADDATIVDCPPIDGKFHPREVMVGGLPVEALVHPDPRPLAIRASSLRTVTTALEDAQIDYFAIPAFSDRGSSIAVREEDRQRMSLALRELIAAPPKVTQLVPAPRTAQSAISIEDRRAASMLAEARVLRLHWTLCDASGSLVFGPTYGVELEMWTASEWREGVHSHVDWTDDDRLAQLNGPRPNRAARMIEASCPTISIDAHHFSRIAGTSPQPSFPIRTREDFAHTLPDEVRFPIDVVYTWVDGSDEEWARQRAEFSPGGSRDVSAESLSASRFVSRDELRYSLRSLFANAPWVHRVFIVTAGQTPSWLRDHPAITVVDHREIFPDPTDLPVFNSHAIEVNLHRIPGLSEHFLYFNDDMFIGRPVAPNAFFQPNGLAKFFPSPSRVAFTKPGPHDTPVEAATKNVRRLIEADFGVSVSQVMEHIPYALRRSVLEEMAERYRHAFDETSRARFRSRADVNSLSNFAHHYGYQIGKAIPSTMSFTYIGLSVGDLGTRLGRLLSRRDRDAFCLNDTFTHEAEIEAQLEIVAPFLDAYFPARPPWEG